MCVCMFTCVDFDRFSMSMCRLDDDDDPPKPLVYGNLRDLLQVSTDSGGAPSAAIGVTYNKDTTSIDDEKRKVDFGACTQVISLVIFFSLFLSFSLSLFLSFSLSLFLSFSLSLFLSFSSTHIYTHTHTHTHTHAHTHTYGQGMNTDAGVKPLPPRPALAVVGVRKRDPASIDGEANKKSKVDFGGGIQVISFVLFCSPLLSLSLSFSLLLSPSLPSPQAFHTHTQLFTYAHSQAPWVCPHCAACESSGSIGACGHSDVPQRFGTHKHTHTHSHTHTRETVYTHRRSQSAQRTAHTHTLTHSHTHTPSLPHTVAADGMEARRGGRVTLKSHLRMTAVLLAKSGGILDMVQYYIDQGEGEQTSCLNSTQTRREHPSAEDMERYNSFLLGDIVKRKDLVDELCGWVAGSLMFLPFPLFLLFLLFSLLFSLFFPSSHGG